jgi:sulfur carrier protein
MRVVVNGDPKDLADGATISALLLVLGVDQQRVAVELNEQVVPRAKHPETTLSAGDRVEVVTFVGGG